jgi:hypothetical protein
MTSTALAAALQHANPRARLLALYSASQASNETPPFAKLAKRDGKALADLLDSASMTTGFHLFMLLPSFCPRLPPPPSFASPR